MRFVKSRRWQRRQNFILPKKEQKKWNEKLQIFQSENTISQSSFFSVKSFLIETFCPK